MRRLVRVCEPPPTHREWLQLFQHGHASVGASAAALGRCLCDDARCTLERRAGHAATTAAGPLELQGRDAVLRELLPSVARTRGHVLHIGRTRHINQPGGAGDIHPAMTAPLAQRLPGYRASAAPLVTQTVLIGDWRPLGAKWYGGMGNGHEFALEVHITLSSTLTPTPTPTVTPIPTLILTLTPTLTLTPQP